MATRYSRPAWVEVDRGAVRKNLRNMRALLGPGTEVMAVVKADAYGHGAREVSKCLKEEGVQRLAVALPEEGAELRESGISGPIHVLAEPSLEAIGLLLDMDLTPAVSSGEFLTQLEKEAGKREKPTPVHLKVDTGMTRMGASWEKAAEIAEMIAGCRNLVFEGAMTHLSCADQQDNQHTLRQLERFDQVLKSLGSKGIKPPLIHAANSAATALYPSSRFNLVRWGISMYGLHPSPETVGKVILTPALSVKAKISRLLYVEKGEPVSYGATYRPSSRALIATLPLGYADGFSRKLSNQAEVLLRGTRAPVRGVVTMDQLMFEVPRELWEKIHTGETVVLLGEDGGDSISADHWAERLETINYEIVCGLSPRLPRIYL